jgi:hypothetical protein
MSTLRLLGMLKVKNIEYSTSISRTSIYKVYEYKFTINGLLVSTFSYNFPANSCHSLKVLRKAKSFSRFTAMNLELHFLIRVRQEI